MYMLDYVLKITYGKSAKLDNVGTLRDKLNIDQSIPDDSFINLV